MSTIRAVLIGKTSSLGRHGVASGIYKQPLDHSVKVTLTGLTGDEQGDKKHHGGLEKSVHHYAVWKAETPELAEALGKEGAFGENISTQGLTEADVCIGDIYRMGTALVEVSQARQPCWRLNERFGNAAMARRVQDSGRTCWYYRIREEGRVGSGDTIELLDRPAADWPLSRILHLLYRDTLNTDDFAQLAELSPLTDSWRLLARRRLECYAVEDWSNRLNSPEEATP